MKGNLLKKAFLSILALMMFVSPLSLQAAEETTEELGVSFEQEYALPGETLSLDITGADVEDCTITWVRNGSVVAELANQTTYTLQDGDLQNLYEVFVSKSGEEVSTRMLISKLPVVYIDIENGEEITTKEPYRDAVIKIQSNDVYKDMGAQYEGKTEIKGRGNSTWGLPKKPYRLKLDKKSNVFGMGKSKHWVLLANYYDTSLLRNTLAYNLSGEMGSTYISSVHVDVVINGTKRGNYQLGEHIRIDEDRVPVFDWEGFGEDVAGEIADVEGLDDDTLGDMEEYLVENMGYITSGSFTFNGTTYNLADYDIEVPEITGGYAIELDEYYDEVSKFKSSLNQPLMFKGPEFVNTNKDMMDYISGYINAFEDAIQNTQDFTTTYDNQTMHYSDLFDMDALIDYWMVQELFFNEDAMKKSSYLYKEIGEKVKMGPIWDMDWSSACMGDVKHTNKWQTNHFGMNAQGQQWYKFLVQDPYYLALAQVRYHE
ncbi:MAG: CotH kinase family protein, partial [Longicatena sp.]|nr:CotH kinase family protein [Longicatena sp.]